MDKLKEFKKLALSAKLLEKIIMQLSILEFLLRNKQTQTLVLELKKGIAKIMRKRMD